MNHVIQLKQQIEQFGLTSGEAQALRLLLCGRRSSAGLVEHGTNVTTILMLKEQGYIAWQDESGAWDITEVGIDALSVYEARRRGAGAQGCRGAGEQLVRLT